TRRRVGGLGFPVEGVGDAPERPGEGAHQAGPRGALRLRDRPALPMELFEPPPGHPRELMEHHRRPPCEDAKRELPDCQAPLYIYSGPASAMMFHQLTWDQEAA